MNYSLNSGSYAEDFDELTVSVRDPTSNEIPIDSNPDNKVGSGSDVQNVPSPSVTRTNGIEELTRPSSAPGTSVSARDTFGSRPKSAAFGTTNLLTSRERLELALDKLHSMDKRKTIKRYSSQIMRPDEKPKEHFVILPEGISYAPSDPLGFTVLHHTTSSTVPKTIDDYRTYRPTSPDRKLHPSKARGDPFLLPGQKDHIGKDFRPKTFRDMLETLQKDSLKAIETADAKWGTHLHELLDNKLLALRKIQKEEMNKLYEDFNSFRDNSIFLDMTRDEEKREHPRLNSHIAPTEEQCAYVEKHIVVQRNNNHNRREVLTSLVRNRHNDELTKLKSTMRAPLELLKRTSDSQREVVVTASNKVVRALLHIEKSIEKTSSHISPSVRLRTERVEEQQLIIIRTALRTLHDLLASVDSLYDKAFLDFCADANLRCTEAKEHNVAQRSASRSRSPASPPSSPTRPSSSQGVSSEPKSILELFEGIGSRKPDRVDLVARGDHHIRTVNGYTYRTRSPPRGSYVKDVEVDEMRPRSSSYLRGHIIRGQHDILNTKNGIPYSGRQFGQGREGLEQPNLPALLTSKRLLAIVSSVDRPSTAPGGLGREVAGLNSRGKNNSEKSGEKNRPRTASAASGNPKKSEKVRPKSSVTASNAPGWDPNFPADYEDDDDASVGIVQDESHQNIDEVFEAKNESKKFQQRLFLETKSDEEVMLEQRKYIPKAISKAPRKIRFGNGKRNPNESLCDECKHSFPSEDSVFIPKVGISPELQKSFRAKQANAQRQLLRLPADNLNASEKLAGNLVRKERDVKKKFGVSGPEAPKAFCSWPCCKRYALRTCHKSMIYDVETIIHLTAGRIIDVDE